MKRLNKKGFTMAELLIVVAIIAVLVAIAIPVFTSQLEKSREAVDAANIRAAYAEVMANGISGETDTSKLTKNVEKKQTDSAWNSSIQDEVVAGTKVSEIQIGDKGFTVTYSTTTNTVTFSKYD